MSPVPKKRPLFGGVHYLEVSVKREFTVLYISLINGIMDELRRIKNVDDNTVTSCGIHIQ